MQKYFDLLLELLRPDGDEFMIEEKKKLSSAWKKIEERGDKGLKIFHRYSFLFLAYEDLLTWKISLDEFLAIWDISSSKKLNINKESSIDTVNSIIKWNAKINDNTLIILDSISFYNISNLDKEAIQKRAKNHSCELIFF